MSEIFYQPNLPAFDEMDREIIKHKQVHFSSSFPAMIAYYKKQKKGAVLDIEVDRLEELQKIETLTGHDLATLVLSNQDVQEIKRAKEAYQKLQQLDKQASELVDLIFSEKENPKELLIQVSKKDQLVPLLCEMLKNEEYYNPLFPGYGLAPILIAKVLTMRKEPKAMAIIFDRLGHLNFEMETQFLHFLASYKEQAQTFLLQILQQKGLDEQIKHATLALSHFPTNQTIAKSALHKLQEADLDKPELTLTLLIEFCRNLKTKEDQLAFSKLKEKTPLHPEIEKELVYIEKQFNK